MLSEPKKHSTSGKTSGSAGAISLAVTDPRRCQNRSIGESEQWSFHESLGRERFHLDQVIRKLHAFKSIARGHKRPKAPAEEAKKGSKLRKSQRRTSAAGRADDALPIIVNSTNMSPSAAVSTGNWFAQVAAVAILPGNSAAALLFDRDAGNRWQRTSAGTSGRILHYSWIVRKMTPVGAY